MIWFYCYCGSLCELQENYRNVLCMGCCRVVPMADIDQGIAVVGILKVEKEDVQNLYENGVLYGQDAYGQE